MNRLRHGYDRVHTDLLIHEFILVPVEARVGREQDVVRWLFVVRHDEDRAGVTEVHILVNFFPREARIAAQERVALYIRCGRKRR